MKKLTGICIITQDVARLRDFYCALLQSEPQGDDVFATFPLPEMQLSLCSALVMDQMAPDALAGAGHGSYTLELEVDDVDGEYRRLSALAMPIVKPPTSQPWGLRSVWLRDPDGNLVNCYAKVPPQDVAQLW
jgi:uncharacterized glyoxalase superfamily protein PhnB